MAISRRRNQVVFLSAWIFVTVSSLAFVGFSFHYPSDLPSNWDSTSNIGGAPFGFIIGAVSGLLLGSPQWILLRNQVKNARRWILTTTLGLGVMHSIGDAFPFGQYLLVATLFSAIVMGIMQRHILRDVLTQPNLWIIISIVGWVGGYLLSMSLLNATGLYPRAWTPTLGATQHAVFGAIQGVVYATVTGVSLLIMANVKLRSYTLSPDRL